jgi:RNA polymerase sigma-70 factor (ECF subfamily)
MNDFQGIYDHYAKALYRFAVALSGNPAEAEDLVADAFVRLWAAPGEIREATVKAYLFTIVRNLFLTRRRQAARHVPLEEGLADPAQGRDTHAAAAQELARLRPHLAALDQTDRTALLMRTAEGYSYDDIGAALGLSAGAVRVRVHRARARLARAIGRTLETRS